MNEAVAELLAVLGVDSRPLEAGLKEAEVMLNSSVLHMLASVNTLKGAFAALSTLIPGAPEGLINKILFGKMGLSGGNSPVDTIQNVLNALRQTGQMEAALNREEANSGASESSYQYSDIEARNIHESQVDAEILAARQAHDAMMAEEAARAEEDQSKYDAEMLSERERMFQQAWQVEMEYYEKRREARLRDIAEERYQANQDFYINNKSAPSNGRSSFAALEFGLSGSNYALGRLLANLPQVQSLMNAAFDVFIVAGFLDILYRVGSEIVELTDNINGWGKANTEAWSTAYKGALDSRLELIKYNEEMGKARAQNIKSPQERAAAEAQVTSKTLVQAEQERARIASQQGLQHMQALAQQLKDLEEPGIITMLEQPGRLANILALRTQISQEYGSVADMQKRINDAEQEEVAISKEMSRLQIEKVREQERSERATSTSARKLRDPVHEYPHLLPWFMGRRMSDDLFGSHSTASVEVAGGLPPMAQSSSFSLPEVTQRRTASRVIGNVRSSGGGVVFSPTYAPVFHFEGMPADVQAFVRDKMEPQLIKDMDGNARGIAKQIKAILDRR